MPTPSAPPPEAVARFRERLVELIPARPTQEPFLGLAVSGGRDSLALLRLANAAFPGRIAAATVNHGLRPEAVNEAAFVAARCAAIGVPHETLGPAPLPSGNIQQAARILRYRLLGDWARRSRIGHVATAHHRDDVAESFLMRAVRGAGIGGLARMATLAPLPHADGAAMLVRPLLDWTRAELAELAPDGIDDPSNADPRFDRARIRALLAASPELDPTALARSATNLAEAEAALEWAADQAWRSRVVGTAPRPSPECCLDPAGLPREIRRRLAVRAVQQIDPCWSGQGIDGLLDRLEKGVGGTVGSARARIGRDGLWRFDIAPPRGGIR